MENDLYIHESVIKYLEMVFDSAPPKSNESLDEMRVRAGEQRVIEHLRTKFKNQQKED